MTAYLIADRIEVTTTGSLPITGSVCVTQCTTPWSVTGSVELTAPITGSVNVTNSIFPTTGSLRLSEPAIVNQGTNPWVVTGSVGITNFPAVQAITASMLPLPDGAATEATVGKRFSGGKRTSTAVISTAGNNTIYTPATGKTLTLYWVGLSSSQNNLLEVSASVKLGAKVVYTWYLGNPGAFSHWEPVAADNADDALIVNLSVSGQNVAVNYTTTEV